MAFLISMFLLVISPFSTAQECSCPVVKCDPCQRRFVIDTQKVQCTPDKSVVCENVVCENVDNYFQCLAKAPAQYVPVENIEDRMTDPRMGGVRMPAAAAQAPKATPEFAPVPKEYPEIDFQHFNHVDSTISTDEKPGVGVVPRFAKLHADAVKAAPLAKEEKSQDSDSFVYFKEEKTEPILFRGLYNATVDGKKVKYGKTQSIVGLEGVVRAQQKQSVWVDYGATHSRWIMSSGAVVRFVKDDKHLIAYPEKGNFIVHDISAKDMLVFDAGDWRVGKAKGGLRWTQKGSDVVIKNEKEKALLRRDQLIAKSEWIDKGTELVISDDYGIVHADQEVPPRDKEFRLKDKSVSPVATGKTRVLASSPISNDGCAQPTGQTQQCAWKCFGSNSKNKTCLNSENTQCVRFTCSLGGEWKLPTRVPGRECNTQSVVVDSCH
ncbi:MAG: hypothetical protein IT287_02840 [Bdellovibrionaceae bacterium]|nr:hypothetical protein [Pseudobdellovibrionaceae bacterium]